MESLSSWRNYHVYYSELNQLVLNCVYPFLQEYDERLETCFWERHYAGGSHLRVRMRGDIATLELVSREFVSDVKRYIAANPSTPVSTYSVTNVKMMLEMEGADSDVDCTRYRVNEVLEVPYQRIHHRLASDAAAKLLEDYLHQSMPLVAAVLRSSHSVREESLRLYFANALLVTGEVPRGCVAYKSHWEGFASQFPCQALVRRIKEKYERDRKYIRVLMLQVAADYADGCFGRDPVLGRWQDLSGQYRARTVDSLRGGDHITYQAKSPEEVRVARNVIMEGMVEDSEFIRTLFADERFLALIQFDHDFLWPRVLINLLYQTVATAGLSMIDKMALCYFSHRAAEDYWGCNLEAVLDHTIRSVITKHASRII